MSAQVNTYASRVCLWGMGHLGDAVSAMGHLGDRKCVSGGSGGRSPPEKVVAELSSRRNVLDPIVGICRHLQEYIGSCSHLVGTVGML